MPNSPSLDFVSTTLNTLLTPAHASDFLLSSRSVLAVELSTIAFESRFASILALKVISRVKSSSSNGLSAVKTPDTVALNFAAFSFAVSRIMIVVRAFPNPLVVFELAIVVSVDIKAEIIFP